MPEASAVEVPFVNVLDYPAELEHDEFDPGRDEKCAFDVKQRERIEAADDKLRRDLCDPKRSRAVYQRLALLSPNKLSHAEFRVLCYLLDRASPDLSNSFASRKTAAEAVGMKLATYNTHLTALRTNGWVRTQEFCRADGTQSSSGVQFCIPSGVLPLKEPWEGPRQFDNRTSGQLKHRSKRPIAVVESINNG